MKGTALFHSCAFMWNFEDDANHKISTKYIVHFYYGQTIVFNLVVDNWEFLFEIYVTVHSSE